MTKPLSPHAVAAEKARWVDPRILEAFNECIAEHWDGHSSEFTVRQVKDRIRAKGLEDIPPEGLDVEPLYRAEGWHVEFDKPGYYESYAASFIFRKRS